MKKIICFALSLLFICSVAIAPVNATNAGSLSNFTHSNQYSFGKFSDIPNGAWYSENVATAYEMGLMKGNSETSFNPQGNLSIAEAIALACRLHSIYFADGEQFVQGTPWYQVYIDYAIKNGIINDTSSNYNVAASRGDFTTILSASLPDNVFTEINSIDLGAIPDIDSNSDYASAVYKLYRAGILTGNDELGTFTPNDSISRDAVAAIVTRMAKVELRKPLTLTATKQAEETTPKAPQSSIEQEKSPVNSTTQPESSQLTTEQINEINKEIRSLQSDINYLERSNLYNEERLNYYQGKLSSAQSDLAAAESKKIRIFKAGEGYVYESDFDAINEAQADVNLYQDKVDYYQALIDSYDSEINSLYEQISELQAELN